MKARDDLDVHSLVNALKALANPTRLRILHWLKDPELHFGDYEQDVDRREVGICVQTLQEKTGLAQSTISSYMHTLQQSRLVLPTRVGRWTYYRRNDPRLSELAHVIDGDL